MAFVYIYTLVDDKDTKATEKENQFIMNYNGIYESPIGPLLIEGTEGGICRVEFDAKLHENYVLEHPILAACKKQLNEYFHHSRKDFDLPLVFNGTEFQKQIWQQLLEIKYSQKITYLEQAIRFGNAKVIRASAVANGKNKIAIIVPCHRVVGVGNELRGYAGGLSRKKWLLVKEQSEMGNTTLFN